MGRPHGRIQLEDFDFVISKYSDQVDSRCHTVTIMVCEQDLDKMRNITSEEDSRSEMRSPAERSRNHAAGERLSKRHVSSQAPVQEAPLLLQEDHERPSDAMLEEDSRKRKRASSFVEEC